MARAARGLGISENMPHKWKCWLWDDPSFEQKPKIDEEVDELRRLHRVNEILRQEAEILE